MPSANDSSVRRAQRAGPVAGNRLPPCVVSRYSQITRLSNSAWPSSVRKVGTWPSGLVGRMRASRFTGPAALGSFSMRSATPSSWATTMHLRTKGDAGEKKIFMAGVSE
ncbi:hypothetical protein D9M72_362600 [compost metagenome]